VALLAVLAACGEDRSEAPSSAAATTPLQGLPADVPLPEDTRAVEELVVGEDGILVSLESDAPADALLRDYRAALETMGWTLDAAPAPGRLSASKDGRTLLLEVGRRASGSRLVLQTTRDAS
jgi:hypothetical protein